VLFDCLENAFKGTENEHLVNDLYQGKMVDYIKTIGYDYESKHITEFLDVSLQANRLPPLPLCEKSQTGPLRDALQVRAFGSEKPMNSVAESLEWFLTPEKLDGENQYYCEPADQRFDAMKGPLTRCLSASSASVSVVMLCAGFRFESLPYILTLQLKRFDLDMQTLQRRKLNDQVRFPFILDMNQYLGQKGVQHALGRAAVYRV
jgi:hypothetical protein